MPTLHLPLRAARARWRTILLNTFFWAFLGGMVLPVVAHETQHPLLLRAEPWALLLVEALLLGGLTAAGLAYFWRKPTPKQTIELSEQTIRTAAGEVRVATLRSIVIESDGYAGQFTTGEKYPHSGGGKLTVTDYAGRQNQWLLTIGSAADMATLRQLTAHWRSQGKTAWMMD